MEEEYLIDTVTMSLEDYKNMKKTIQELQDRIDKAIEYINENNLKLREEMEYCNDVGIFDEFVGKVDRILRGSDKE